MDRITSLANDLALALAASSIRIEAPVPGKAIIGIEVPNTVSSAVSFAASLKPVFPEAGHKIQIDSGTGEGGRRGSRRRRFGKNAASTHRRGNGSGKTVCLNAIIACLLMQNTPDELRFIMIDPSASN